MYICIYSYVRKSANILESLINVVQNMRLAFVRAPMHNPVSSSRQTNALMLVYMILWTLMCSRIRDRQGSWNWVKARWDGWDDSIKCNSHLFSFDYSTSDVHWFSRRMQRASHVKMWTLSTINIAKRRYSMKRYNRMKHFANYMRL